MNDIPYEISNGEIFIDFGDISDTHPEYAALNDGQKQAVGDVLQFLLGPDKEFRISGPAGVGKTHLMKFIMAHTVPDYERICALLEIKPLNLRPKMTATTNKAAEVLSSSTGREAQTIHTFMNLRVFDNYSTGRSEISRTANWMVHSHLLLFVDEASMIDRELHKFLMEGTDKTCKIIYLGDHCQMAPVTETLSPVYANEGPVANLTQPMRNANQPALMALCDQLRLTVETGKFYPIVEVPGVIEYLAGQDAYDFINADFFSENHDSRILVYSNARAQEYNHYIRSLRGYPTEFIVGEILVNNNSLPVGSKQGSAIIPPEHLVRVMTVGTSSYMHEIEAGVPASTIEVYDIQLQSVKEGMTFKKMIPVNADLAKGFSKAYARQKKWPIVFWIRDNFPDLRQKDASTVYKAQGSTYHTVLLDLANIGNCTQNDQLARMLYVGASRPTTRLYLYGALPPRLFK